MKTENEKAREIYRAGGIHYSDIHMYDIEYLMYFIGEELKKCDNELKMTVCKLRKRDVSYALDGSIERCHIMVGGAYFSRREAISFNRKDKNGGEFIGISGWSGSENTKPFISAFKLWLEWFNVPF